MSYSPQIADAIEDFFHKKDLIIVREETSNGNECLIHFRTKLKSKIQTAHEYIIIRDNNFSILTTIPINADEDHRLALAEYLTRVNFNMRIGNFELDMTDGEIRFKEYAFVGDGPVQTELIASMVFIPLQMIDRRMKPSQISVPPVQRWNHVHSFSPVRRKNDANRNKGS